MILSQECFPVSSDWHSQDKGGLIEIHSDEAVEVSSEDDKAMGMGVPWIGRVWWDMGRYDQAGMFGDVFEVYVTQTNIDIIWGDDE